MKISENWLRQWVDPKASTQAVAERLVMGGLELEIEPVVAELPSGVVVGRIVGIAPHPDADRLRICQVDVGAAEPSTIVCGAANARQGLLVPCALLGARLPGGLEIKLGKLRGVESAGMLCSAKELGLAEKSEGLLELAADAPVGMPIEQYLDLRDQVLHLELTPNRGDCLSVLGLAREISALFGVPLQQPSIAAAAVTDERRFEVAIENVADCPSFTARLITGLDPQAVTPDWMRERLRRSGVRSIHPLVDITNYVMLELGQPMHAYDAERLSGRIEARRARAGERVRLLNDQEVVLSDELVIADERGPLGLAGVMGGAQSAVSANSTTVLFESAAFSMAAVTGVGRRHKLNSDALYRFERGIDQTLQLEALERATGLTLAICGGKAGPVSTAGRSAPEPVEVVLRHARLNRLLGLEIPASEVELLLQRLGIALRADAAGSWIATIPSHRHDLRIEADLIEEVARLYGYERIPAKPYAAWMAPSRPAEAEQTPTRARELLVARGWQDIVTLAFVEPATQALLDPQTAAIAVDNPIAEPLSVMRTTLWSGLIAAWRHNQARQVSRVRLFEAGVCFTERDGEIVETSRLAGLAAGSALAEQWSAESRVSDFYDLKADVEALLAGVEGGVRFEAAAHPALHPGQSAAIRVGGLSAGWLGRLHPRLVTALDLPEAPLLFELDWERIKRVRLPKSETWPELPWSRRDLALVVPEALSADALCDAFKSVGNEQLSRVFVFDVYRGPGLPEASKSMALGLIFQDCYRTLTVDEVDAAVQQLLASVKQLTGATVRA